MNIDSYDTEEACMRLKKLIGKGRGRSDVMKVCNHAEVYDKDAVMIMLGYYFPTRENFDSAIEEFAQDDVYGEGSGDRIEYSLRKLAKEYEDFY